MGKRRAFLSYSILILSICSLILSVSNYNINKQRGYYIGKIESINSNNEITTVEISPVSSNRYFISEIKRNHKIEYADNIGIAGVSDQRKDSKKLRLGELGEMIENLKTGDDIIFKARNYDKDSYKIEIDELGVDLTLE